MVMLSSIVLHSNFDYHSRLMEDIEDQIESRKFKHYASELLENGLHDQEELERSLHKAITAVIAARLQAAKHFRTV